MRQTVFGFLTIAFVASAASGQAPLRPAALAPGDTIMFVAPAGEVRPDDVEVARKRLAQMEFVVRVPENLTRQRGYLAGTDEERAAELMRAFRDPDVDAVFSFTGGFGTTRMLDRLDYEAIAAHPKILIGFSDITGLHLALAARTGLITFHAPNVDSGLGRPQGLSDFSARYFWRCLLAENNRQPGGFAYETPADAALKVIRGGKARGRMTGGNLSLVAALMGTPYEIETDGRIVFLEDVNEAPYRVDRMLSQLRLAGKLRSPAAVVLGQFTKSDTAPDEPSLTLNEVFDDYFGQASYPVVANFPAGHHRWNATLPLGAEFEVDTAVPRVRVLENPVVLPTR